MPMSFGGWSPLGVGAALAIVAGIVLLVVYALQRGLVHRELDGTEAEPAEPAGPTLPTPTSGRALGIAGAMLLAVGLTLGLLSAVAGWGGAAGTGTGPGGGPDDCAQSWSGCPQATAAP